MSKTTHYPKQFIWEMGGNSESRLRRVKKIVKFLNKNNVIEVRRRADVLLDWECITSDGITFYLTM